MPEQALRYKTEYLSGGVRVFTSPAHTFGTDAVLLAHFSAPKLRDRACDFGTGCGIIPLLWCAAGRCSRIDGVELQEEAAAQAQQGVRENGLQERLFIHCADLKNAPGFLPAGGFDLVTMNPPYQKLGAGLISREESGRIARHESACTLEDAAFSASRLLRFGGRFCLCLRPERLCDALEAMRKAGCEPKRLRFVQKTAGSAPWLFLAEGKRGAKPGLSVEPPLFLYAESGEYSEDYQKIYDGYRKDAL